MQPLIQPEWDFAIWAVLCLLAALGFWGDTTRVGKNVSGLAILLAVGMALSNFGVIPKNAPAYGVVWSYLVPIAIPLLLLKADLRRVLTETGSLLPPFILGAVGTVIGALLGVWLLPLGEHSAELAGIFSATYIGGSMNMAAVAKSLQMDPSVVSASVAADNVIGVLYLALLALIPSIKLFQAWFKHGQVEPAVVAEAKQQGASSIAILDIAIVLGIACVICTLGNALAEFMGIASYNILVITALSVVVANLFPKQLKALKGDFEIGLLFMYLFFAAIGASADVMKMASQAPLIAVFCAIVVVCHAFMAFVFGRFFKCNLMDVVIASNACASGPASAAALAAGKGRQDLVAPAVLVGVLGYAVANFIGVAIVGLLSS